MLGVVFTFIFPDHGLSPSRDNSCFEHGVGVAGTRIGAGGGISPGESGGLGRKTG